MDRKQMHELILPEEQYAREMEEVAEPFLAAHMTEKYCEWEPGEKIFFVRGTADAPRGVVVISHGYTETVEKHKENIYYFLKAGYHVCMPEHCGHGRSYRLTEDLSLVHVDDYHRYVRDLLHVAGLAAGENPGLPLYLYGHSMGGGIAAAAAAKMPELFAKVILNSPMIRPSTGRIPWRAAKAFADLKCLAGKQTEYVLGHQAYSGKESFADSAATSRARFSYYQEKRFREPLFQMSAASYGWSREALRLSRYLLARGWKRIQCPVLVFQAEEENYVSKQAMELFVRRLHRKNGGRAALVRMPGSRHETFFSDSASLEIYWRKVFRFLEDQASE